MMTERAREQASKGGKETIFIFQPRQRREMSGSSKDWRSINIRSREQKEMGERRHNKGCPSLSLLLHIYMCVCVCVCARKNITESFTISQCQSVRR